MLMLAFVLVLVLSGCGCGCNLHFQRDPENFRVAQVGCCDEICESFRKFYKTTVKLSKAVISVFMVSHPE